ncbi:MAG: zinc ribbon domain-containing protein, partial [Deltaproteobacteria bacterium]
MSIWCPECGRKNDDTQRACVACGESLALPEEVVDMKVYPVDAPRALQDEKTVKATSLPADEEKTHLIPRKAQDEEERTEVLPATRKRGALPKQGEEVSQSDPLSKAPHHRGRSDGEPDFLPNPSPTIPKVSQKRGDPASKPDVSDPANPLLPRNLYPPSGQEAFPSEAFPSEAFTLEEEVIEADEEMARFMSGPLSDLEGDEEAEEEEIVRYIHEFISDQAGEPTSLSRRLHSPSPPASSEGHAPAPQVPPSPM